MRADVHMHTSFSHDSEAEPREMIEGAIAKGLEVICFTDHYDKDYMGWGDESIFDADAYFGTLRPLQEEYRDRIDIRIGVELGMQPRLGDFFTEFTKKYPFDFVIGSLHVVDGDDPALGTVFEGRTDEEVYRQAFVEMLEDIENTPDFDVLGHIDYVVRYGKKRNGRVLLQKICRRDRRYPAGCHRAGQGNRAEYGRAQIRPAFCPSPPGHPAPLPGTGRRDHHSGSRWTQAGAHCL